MRQLALLLGFTLLLTGCANRGEIDPDMTEADLYNKAHTASAEGKYIRAVEHFQALESRYPFGEYADRGQLEIIHAHYKNGDYPEAGAAAERFIRLYPDHPQADYAYYMRGLSSYTESQGLLERFMPTDHSKRDPGAARKSFAEFSELLTRYPNSQYAPDARKRMVHLRNMLARYEIHAANYLFKRGAWLAAANRGRYVVENFQESPAVPDGLAVMVQAYHLLGLHDLSEQSLAVLKQNYPDYPALDENGNFQYQQEMETENRSWLNAATAGLIGKSEPKGFDSRAHYGVEGQRYVDD